jgi:hypothetical protein
VTPTCCSDCDGNKKKRGFKKAHRLGTAYEWDSAAARTAGRRGGEIVSKDRMHMSEIGRRCGQARRKKKPTEEGKERA